MDKIAAINACLPQTQCQRCGYTGCKPYAEAIANDGEQINRCPPGGEQVIEKLAALLSKPPISLNSELKPYPQPLVAVIDESSCIGCTKCLPACPVDAIVGAGKLMHTVISDRCSGCELCIAPCPMDCIRMEPIAEFPRSADQFKQQHELKLQREAAKQAAKKLEQAAKLNKWQQYLV